MFLSGFLLLALSLVAKAAPVGEGAANDNVQLVERAGTGAAFPKFCSSLSPQLLTAARASAATPYCSSLLSIPAITKTATTTRTVQQVIITNRVTQVIVKTASVTVRSTKTGALNTVTRTAFSTIFAIQTDISTSYLPEGATQTVTESAFASTAANDVPASTVTTWANCGLTGVDGGLPPYFESVDGSLASFDACSGQCQSDPGCLTFAYSDTACMLYTAEILSNFIAMANSPYLFFDRNCPKESDPSSNQEATQGKLRGASSASKRALAIPAQLRPFPARQVASACSCIPIPIRTTTATSTVTTALRTITQNVPVKQTSTLTRTFTSVTTKAARITTVTKTLAITKDQTTTIVSAIPSTILSFQTTTLAIDTSGAGITTTITLTASSSASLPASSSPSTTADSSSTSASVSDTALPTSTNLLANPSFESPQGPLASWSSFFGAPASASNQPGHNSPIGLGVTCQAPGQCPTMSWLQQEIDTEVGRSYTFGFDVKFTVDERTPQDEGLFCYVWPKSDFRTTAGSVVVKPRDEGEVGMDGWRAVSVGFVAGEEKMVVQCIFVQEYGIVMDNFEVV